MEAMKRDISDLIMTVGDTTAKKGETKLGADEGAHEIKPEPAEIGVVGNEGNSSVRVVLR